MRSTSFLASIAAVTSVGHGWSLSTQVQAVKSESYYIMACCTGLMITVDPFLHLHGTKFLGMRTTAPYFTSLENFVDLTVDEITGTVEYAMEKQKTGQVKNLLALIGDPEGPFGAKLGYVSVNTSSADVADWAVVNSSTDQKVHFNQWWVEKQSNGQKYLRWGSKDLDDTCRGFVPEMSKGMARWVANVKIPAKGQATSERTCTAAQNLMKGDFELMEKSKLFALRDRNGDKQPRDA